MGRRRRRRRRGILLASESKDVEQKNKRYDREQVVRVEGQKKQVKLPETPSTWEVSYTFVTNPTEQPEGIIVVLKKVSADFAQEEAQTKTQTDSDQPVFDEDMKRCSILKKEDLSRSLA